MRQPNIEKHRQLKSPEPRCMKQVMTPDILKIPIVSRFADCPNLLRADSVKRDFMQASDFVAS